jgi:acetylornithine deacetylase/succinyl-diaminopimelate desuccinylase-like protein
MREASDTYYGQAKLSFGEGGTIPLMETLKSTWPKGQFLITGVLGPMSNAHGPNEFLHIPYVKKLICCIAHIIAKR